MTGAVKNKLKEVSGSGTSYQGRVRASYSVLVDIFGEPHELNGDKTLAEWRFKDTETDVVFTIYDWKNYGFSRFNVTDWHIGGVDGKAVDTFHKFYV